ncbi:MAG: hypothetical protein ACTSXP_10505 [Promethearchaeota archaeon]
MSQSKSFENQDNGVKAVIISTIAGTPLVTIKLNEKVDECLITPFISAIHSFSREVMGNDQEIYFKSGNLDLYCLTKKYDRCQLRIFALMDLNMKKLNIKDEAEAALDAFVLYFGEDNIINWNGDSNFSNHSSGFWRIRSRRIMQRFV